MSSTKICSKCKKRKRLTGFHVDRSKKDGRQHWCKSCMIIATGNRVSARSEAIKRLVANHKHEFKVIYGVVLKERGIK